MHVLILQFSNVFKIETVALGVSRLNMDWICVEHSNCNGFYSLRRIDRNRHVFEIVEAYSA